MTRAAPPVAPTASRWPSPTKPACTSCAPSPHRCARQAGLQPIGTTTTSTHGKPLISPLPSQAELQARRKSERLEMATDSTPVRNSTQRGKPYTCPELRTNPYRPGSADAYSLPSRTSFAKKG